MKKKCIITVPNGSENVFISVNSKVRGFYPTMHVSFYKDLMLSSAESETTDFHKNVHRFQSDGRWDYDRGIYTV